MAMRMPQGIPARKSCPSHPNAGPIYPEWDPPDAHECLPDEMRCAYCGERLAPEQCSLCRKFMAAGEMHAAATDGVWHCKECQ